MTRPGRKRKALSAREPSGRPKRPSQESGMHLPSMTMRQFIDLGRQRVKEKGWKLPEFEDRDHEMSYWLPLMPAGILSTALYVIETVGGPIKIGVSLNPGRRAAEIQTSQDKEVLVYWAIRMDHEDAYALEQELHKKLKGSRFHQRGEWYWMDAETAAAMVCRCADERAMPFMPDEKYGNLRGH